MAGNTLRLSLPRDGDAPTRLWAAMAALPGLASQSAEQRFRVELALSEVVTNILRHSGGDQPLRVRVRTGAGVLSVLVASDGVAFDMSREARLPVELLAEGGRGLFLIRECASRLSYRHRHGWNLHRLVFRCDPSGIEHPLH